MRSVPAHRSRAPCVFQKRKRSEIQRISGVPKQSFEDFCKEKRKEKIKLKKNGTGNRNQTSEGHILHLSLARRGKETFASEDCNARTLRHGWISCRWGTYGPSPRGYRSWSKMQNLRWKIKGMFGTLWLYRDCKATVPYQVHRDDRDVPEGNL